MQNRLRISLVIPAYNEESYLEDCLRSASAQRLPFHEIIVIDNNSSDDTSLIARRFPSVRIIHEPRQGVVYARTTGFDATSGDLIARIDADTRLPVDWTEALQEIFAEGAVDAVSGRMEFYDMAAPRLINGLDLFFRRYFARVLGPQVALQASNMAIKRSTWRSIRAQTCKGGDIHEDFDLAIHAFQGGHTVTFDERLAATIGCRQVESSFRNFCSYVWLSPRTYRVHRMSGHWWMYPVVGLVIGAYGLLKLLHRDTYKEGRFSLLRLLYDPAKARVNPATYVD
jgi:glycosyltransferase involved in cell wall biosynthesis